MNETCPPEVSKGAIRASAVHCCTACGGVFKVPNTQICLECGTESGTESGAAPRAERLTLTLCLIGTLLLLLGAWTLG